MISIHCPAGIMYTIENPQNLAYNVHIMLSVKG